MTHYDLNDDLQSSFDEEWYYSQYSSTIDKLRQKGETIFDFYVRVGGRLGHDPNAGFSEIAYRQHNLDVYDNLLADKNNWGYNHFFQYGRKETRRPIPSKIEAEHIRKIVVHLDPQFLIETYDIDSDIYVSPFDFYFMCVKELFLSPSPSFSEAAYRGIHGDVDDAVRAGRLRCGFEHLLITLNSEQRNFLTDAEYREKQRKEEAETRKKTLELNLPGITHTHAFDVLKMMESVTPDIDLVYEPGQQLGMIALVPNFLPEILFGGYLAFFEFLRTLQEMSGLDLRLIIFNQISESKHKWNIMRMKQQNNKITSMFSSIEFLAETNRLHIYAGYKVISYCAETHYMARRIANKLGSDPMFFIQEYEPAFHANGDYFTFSHNAFLLPHFGIYNSKVLLSYFLETAGLAKAHGKNYRYCSFENHIKKMTLSSQEFVEKNSDKRVRRLVFYGRPEQHAARNHFATFVLGLREALRRGYFEGNQWDFVSIGSLFHEGALALADNHKLRILTKMPLNEYVEFLETGDVGVSFISTPHPGIVHFQMANYGLVTLTNTADNRSAAWLSEQNKNIIGVDLRPDAIAEGLKMAIARSLDLDARYENARNAPYLSKSDCVQPAIDAVLAEIGFVQEPSLQEPPPQEPAILEHAENRVTDPAMADAASDPTI